MKLYFNKETGKFTPASSVWAERDLMLHHGYIDCLGQTSSGEERYDSLNYSFWRKQNPDGSWDYTKVSKGGQKKKRKMHLFGWEIVIDEDHVVLDHNAIDEEVTFHDK